MSYPLSDADRSVVSMLSADGRYEYFVEKAVAGGEIWSLQCDDGWVVMLSQEEEECLPVWPHRDFAAQWADGEWADCKPAMVPLDVWLERWTPGMEQDGTLLVVFPDSDEEGTIVTPRELGGALEKARAKR
jgi:hypothetical protein